MKRPTTQIAFFVVLFLATCSSAQKYTVTDLGVFGGDISYATAINDSGQVVGASYINKATAVDHAFVWSATTGLQDLGTLGGYNSRAMGINNAGQVVGCADVSLNDRVPSHAFLWTQSGGMQDLGSLGGGSCAFAINDAGQVVGYSTVNTNFDQHAFLWTAASGMQDLGVPVSSETFAASINDSGMVVGTYYESVGGTHAFLWTQAGGIEDLGSLGVQEVSAGSINDLGQVVGSSEVPPGRSDLYAGFVWTASRKMVRLPSPYPNNDATASAINATGEIAGFSLNPKIEQRATVWLTPSNVHDLNEFAPSSPLILEMASGLNNLGQIVGVGTDKKNSAITHAYVATPTGK